MIFKCASHGTEIVLCIKQSCSRLLLGLVGCPWGLGLDVAFQQTTSKFLFLISSQKGSNFQQISREIPWKFRIFLSRGSKSQVLSTSFWQCLHCSRCRGLNLDMGRVWRLPGGDIIAIFSMMLTFFAPEIANFRSPAGASVGSERS